MRPRRQRLRREARAATRSGGQLRRRACCPCPDPTRARSCRQRPGGCRVRQTPIQSARPRARSRPCSALGSPTRIHLQCTRGVRRTIQLRAAVDKTRKRRVDTRDDLTGQVRQIARLAREGLSNPEIGARVQASDRGDGGTTVEGPSCLCVSCKRGGGARATRAKLRATTARQARAADGHVDPLRIRALGDRRSAPGSRPRAFDGGDGRTLRSESAGSSNHRPHKEDHMAVTVDTAAGNTAIRPFTIDVP
jgi:hypothetical protein